MTEPLLNLGLGTPFLQLLSFVGLKEARDLLVPSIFLPQKGKQGKRWVSSRSLEGSSSLLSFSCQLGTCNALCLHRSAPFVFLRFSFVAMIPEAAAVFPLLYPLFSLFVTDQRFRSVLLHLGLTISFSPNHPNIAEMYMI